MIAVRKNRQFRLIQKELIRFFKNKNRLIQNILHFKVGWKISLVKELLGLVIFFAQDQTFLRLITVTSK